MNASPTQADWTRLTADASMSLFQAIERALDGGANELIVVDEAGRPIGRFTLDGARKLVTDGRYFRATARDAATPLEGKGTLAIGTDGNGRLTGVSVDLRDTFIPVAEPSLTRAEFRNLMDAFLSTWISSTGSYIRNFEANFAGYVGMREGVAVSNGTVSLHLALLALGIGPGDEVIVPDLTFAATINTVIMTGATPVIVDVDPVTWCISAEAFEAAVSPRTRAVIPVHVFGRTAPMVEIAEIAARRRIYVIEDCAEAHGARVGNSQVGTYSHIASYSFFANKIITTGEGGMCLTNDPELARRMRMLRDHGMRPERRYWHEEVGYNYRMTNLAAAIGQAQLDQIADILAWRRKLQALYAERLAGIPGLEMPGQLPPNCEPVAWFVCALAPADKRPAMIQACKEANVDLRPFFHGLSTMPAYKAWARPCPVSEGLAARGVNLPTSHRIGEAEVDKIAGALRRVLA